MWGFVWNRSNTFSSMTPLMQAAPIPTHFISFCYGKSFPGEFYNISITMAIYEWSIIKNYKISFVRSNKQNEILHYVVHLKYFKTFFLIIHIGLQSMNNILTQSIVNGFRIVSLNISYFTMFLNFGWHRWVVKRSPRM